MEAQGTGSRHLSSRSTLEASSLARLFCTNPLDSGAAHRGYILLYTHLTPTQHHGVGSISRADQRRDCHCHPEAEEEVRGSLRTSGHK